MPKHEVQVATAGVERPVPGTLVRRAVGSVLDGEEAGNATIQVVFLSSQRMRALNRKTFGRDRSTDVIAFALPHGDALFGDIYVCPAAVRRGAAEHAAALREEFARVLIHGTLHVLGFDHPERDRVRSGMWQRQERYVQTVIGGGR